MNEDEKNTKETIQSYFLFYSAANQAIKQKHEYYLFFKNCL